MAAKGVLRCCSHVDVTAMRMRGEAKRYRAVGTGLIGYQKTRLDSVYDFRSEKKQEGVGQLMVCMLELAE